MTVIRNDLTIYDKVADRWWSDDICWVWTLKNLVPGCLKWFNRQIDWTGGAILDLRLLLRGTHDPAIFIKPAQLRGAMKQAGFIPCPFTGLGPRGLKRRPDLTFGPCR